MLEDFVSTGNAVRVIDIFVDELDLSELGFKGVMPKDTGRPNYHPAMLFKLNLYCYLNRIQSSRRLEREANCNIELVWLTEQCHVIALSGYLNEFSAKKHSFM